MNQDEFNRDLDNYIGSRRKIKKNKTIKKRQMEASTDEEKKLPEDSSKVYMIKGKPSKFRAFWMGLFSKKEVEIEETEKEFEEDLEKIEQKEEKLEENIQEMEAEEREMEKEKSNTIWKFLSKIFTIRREEEEIQKEIIGEKQTTQMNDIKKLAKISMKYFNMLPREDFEYLKSSEDFREFKEILKKHSLIKEGEQKI